MFRRNEKLCEVKKYKYEMVNYVELSQSVKNNF
jgi:hypothetical protein